MKRKSSKILLASVLALSLLGTSCIGRFAMTNKLLSWNRQIGNKFLNELVFFAFWVLPVYEVTMLADVVVLNSIEFWGGTNPLEANNTTTVVEGNTGRYLVKRDADGYTITSEADQSVVRLQFDANDQSWSVSTPDSEPVKFMTMIDASHVGMLTPDGTMTPVELTPEAVADYARVCGAPLFALR